MSPTSRAMARKRQQQQRKIPKTRAINSLPDCVLLSILCHASEYRAITVAQLSCVCRRWHALCLSIPALSFDKATFFPHYISIPRFFSLARSHLSRHRPGTLAKLKLAYQLNYRAPPPTMKNFDSWEHFRWLDCPAVFSIKKLSLHKHPLCIPQQTLEQIFERCRSLESIRLGGASVAGDLMLPETLPHLLSVWFSRSTISTSALQRLVRASNATLIMLKLQCCWGFSSCALQAPKLVVCEISVPRGSAFVEPSVVLDAPALQNLTLGNVAMVALMGCPSLESLKAWPADALQVTSEPQDRLELLHMECSCCYPYRCCCELSSRQLFACHVAMLGASVSHLHLNFRLSDAGPVATTRFLSYLKAMPCLRTLHVGENLLRSLERPRDWACDGVAPLQEIHLLPILYRTTGSEYIIEAVETLVLLPTASLTLHVCAYPLEALRYVDNSLWLQRQDPGRVLAKAELDVGCPAECTPPLRELREHLLRIQRTYPSVELIVCPSESKGAYKSPKGLYCLPSAWRARKFGGRPVLYTQRLCGGRCDRCSTGRQRSRRWDW